MRKIGRRGREYLKWRDTIAIPYLDKTYGRRCSAEGCQNTNLDVAHILGRGSHPKLRTEVTNVVYKCRAHHLQEHLSG